MYDVEHASNYNDYLTQRVNLMKMHEMILDILDREGSIPFPALCHELSKFRYLKNIQDYYVHPATVKSVISRKNDLFMYKNNKVAIHPNKQVVLLVADVGDGKGSWYKIKADFSTKIYTYFEWHLKNKKPVNKKLPEADGDINNFKCGVYRSEIWNWSQNYESEEGIVLDGTSWSVKLVTVGKTYESRGFQKFPQQWDEFCNSVQKLTGKPFC